MNTKNYAGIAWPSMFIILTGIYAYWAAQRELVSSRPSTPGQFDVPDPVPMPGVRTVHSRMWEDPLSSAYHHWKSLDKSERKTGLWTFSDGTTNALAATAKEVAARSNRIEQLRTQMKDHFRDLVDKQPTVCLPVFVQGGPYAEDKETRMRTRYGVVTALAESGYYLKYSTRMSYLVTDIYVRVLRGWQEREFVVPVKLYANDNTGKWLIVLWINESELGLRPLLATHRILNEVFSKVTEPQNLDISIIGPASSGTLKNMATEARHPKPGAWRILTDKVVSKLEALKLSPDGLERNGLISWQGVEAKLKEMEAKLKEMKPAPESPEPQELKRLQQKFASLKHAYHWEISSYASGGPIEGFAPLVPPFETGQDSQAYKTVSIFSPRATMDGIKFPRDNLFFKLYRVIGTDGHLASSLQEELEIRGVLPGDVVLITEHDTAYGREIHRTLKDAFNLADEGEETEDKAGVLFTFRILRGIDGILPGDPKETPKSMGGGTGSFDPAEIVERPPEGRSQYDYLERLPDRIRAKVPDGPVAIGVVGSDVYDKLLVLRALRPKFLDCLFFTTDLHSIYTHSNERQHARNLIVASHFGLTLGNTLQQQTPPFRDSYQTATFLATRLAIVTGKENQATNLVAEADKLRDAPGTDYFVKAVAETIRSKAAAVGQAGSAQELRLAADEIMREGGKINADQNENKEIYETVENIKKKAKVVKDVTEIEKHWEAWNDVLTRLDGDDPNHAFIKPMIHVVGRHHPHQLTTFEDGSVESRLQPAPIRGMRGWHVLFVTVVTFGVVCGILLLTLRDRFRISLLLGRGHGYFDSDWIEKVQGWRKGLNISFLTLLGVGSLFACGLVINAWWGYDVATPLGGYTTWSRNILYAFTGMAAVISIAYLVDRFIVTLNEAKQDGGKICERAWETFQMTHVLKGAVLAVVFAQIGVLFVCGFNSLATLCLSTLGFAGLACAAWCYRTPLTDNHAAVGHDAEQTLNAKANDGVKKNLILNPCPRGIIWWAIGVMFAITAAAGLVGLLEGPAPGWIPSSMSRAWITRSGDWVVRAYAFGMVGVLLSSLLYCLFWCIEFSRHAKQQVSADFPSPADAGLQMESELDRLRLVGKLTSVTGGLAPAAMGLLLVLAIAYHPVVSPTPMPMGLLAVITIGLGVFVGPILLARWHFNSDHRQVLLELQEQLSVRPLSSDDRQQKSTEALAAAPSELEDDSGEPARVLVPPGADELSVKEKSDERVRQVARPAQPDKPVVLATAARAHEDRKYQLEQCQQQIETLSDGVFKPWAQSPIGWILGGGASLALIDLWIRWWTLGG